MSRTGNDRRDQERTVHDLLERHGTTYAASAGITLRDKPMPLFQLLVLTLLSSARISADIAVDAARELFEAGWRTPDRLRGSTWQERVDALGRGGYRRYDESTATRLAEAAGYVLDTYAGDLRRIRPSRPEELPDVRAALLGVPRIGPTGAGIFLREAQAVWPGLGPVFDRRARDEALRLGLPTDATELAGLAPRDRVAELAAALVRSSRAEPGRRS